MERVFLCGIKCRTPEQLVAKTNSLLGVQMNANRNRSGLEEKPIVTTSNAHAATSNNRVPDAAHCPA